MSRQEFTQRFTEHTYWHMDGEIIAKPPYNGTAYNGKITTVAAAANFNETNRTNALVETLADAKKVLIKPPNGTTALWLRFRADGTAGDQHVLQLFAASGIDHYSHFAQLTIDQGAQFYSGIIYFIDTVVPANEKWPTDARELTSTSDYIGGYILNTHGNDRFWIVASTLDTTGGAPNMGNLYIDWKVI